MKGLLHILAFLCFLATVNGLTCGSCPDVLSPKHCIRTATCSPDDMCMVQEKMMGGQRRFTLECHSKRACTVLKMYSFDSAMCLECCETDNCNTDLCARTTTIPTTTATTTTPKPTTQPPPYIETSVPSVTTRWGTKISIACIGYNVDYITVTQAVHHHKVVLYNGHTSNAVVSVTPKDDMTVVCEGYRHGQKPITTSTIPIKVTGEAPHFTQNKPVPISVTGGQNYSLNCQPKGYPTPVVTWHYSRIPGGHVQVKDYDINIINMNEKMSGHYQCTAHNLFGTATITYVISYTQPATTPPPTTQPTQPLALPPVITLPSVKVIEEGEPATVIKCDATGSPLPKITWTPLLLGSFPANVQVLSKYLVIKNAGVYDNTFFMCKAENSAGQDIKVIHIIVNHKVKPTTARPHVKPSINAPQVMEVTYGTPVTLTCNATGFPEPSITWHVKHKTIRHNSLVINNATLSDDGLYVCIATNDAGHVQTNTILSVSGVSPTITQAPTSKLEDTGASEIFTCKATGVPKPTITWSYLSFLHASTQMPAHVKSPDGTQIRLTSIHDSGTLTCTAQNPYGTVTAHANILMASPNNIGLGR